MADSVSKRSQPYYLDLVHMTEEGYGIVAQRIYESLKKEFPLALEGSPE